MKPQPQPYIGQNAVAILAEIDKELAPTSRFVAGAKSLGLGFVIGAAVATLLIWRGRASVYRAPARGGDDD